MIDCDPNSPCNQIRNWEPWKPKKKRKKRKATTGFKTLTRLQRIHRLWARQNELSRLDRSPASADLGFQIPECGGQHSGDLPNNGLAGAPYLP